MTKMIFVNLPVKNLDAAIRVYEAIGCEKNPQFSDDKAAAMAWSDTITFMLLTKAYFATFVTKPIADPQAATGALYALSFDSRAAVDAAAEAAARAGGQGDVRPAQDYGWMYTRAIADADGHVIEAAWMDMEAASQAMAEPDAQPA